MGIAPAPVILMRMSLRQSLILLALLLATVVVTTSCRKAAPPPSPAPAAAPAHKPPTRVPDSLLDDVVEEAAAHLAQALGGLPEEQAPGKKPVLALAPLTAQGRISDDRFDAVVQSLPGRLQAAPALTQRVTFIPTTFDDARDVVASPSDAAPGAGEAARHPPESVYVLRGRYAQAGSGRDGNVRYRLVVEVQHVASRRMVASKQFRSSLVWDGVAGRWVRTQD